MTPRPVRTRAPALFDGLGLPAKPAMALDPTTVVAGLASDKKRKGSALRFVLCDAPGSAVVQPVPLTEAEGAIRAVLDNGAAVR